MILHIATDDKFIPFLQGLFEEAKPNENMWRIITDKPTLKFGLQINDTRTIDWKYFISEDISNDFKRSKYVILHSMMLSGLQAVSLINRLPDDIVLIWRGWGFDYYKYIFESQSRVLTLPETTALARKKELLFNSPRKIPKKLIINLFYKSIKQKIDKWLIKRVDYFSCCVPDDFEALSNSIPEFSAKFTPLNYYSKEDTFLHGENLEDLTGKDILLGNSASETNNHVEAIRILSKIDLSGRKVIVPLSYGDMDYQKQIISIGRDLLGDAFIPLTEFLTLPQYNKIISNCGSVIMNHVRQQGIGNISATLLRGGKVFLRPENPIYIYYTRLGIKIFQFTDALSLKDLVISLTEDEIVNNRHIMSNIWERDQGLRQVNAIFSLK